MCAGRRRIAKTSAVRSARRAAALDSRYETYFSAARHVRFVPVPLESGQFLGLAMAYYWLLLASLGTCAVTLVAYTFWRDPKLGVLGLGVLAVGVAGGTRWSFAVHTAAFFGTITATFLAYLLVLVAGATRSGLRDGPPERRTRWAAIVVAAVAGVASIAALAVLVVFAYSQTLPVSRPDGLAWLLMAVWSGPIQVCVAASVVYQLRSWWRSAVPTAAAGAGPNAPSIDR